MAIPDEDVAQVRAATDIVALIGEHSALKKVGRRFTGLCPFHGEKTPSFSVNAEEGLYYCFGCQVSGDAISFVRAIEGCDFVEAVERLAARAGVTIHNEEDPHASQERAHRQRIFEAMSAAADFYHERLLTGKDAGPARNYLRSRGYTGEIVREFRLGYAPAGYGELAKTLKYPTPVLQSAGLIYASERGQPQDAFRDRVIFPIFDTAGKAIALGGRYLPEDLRTSTREPGPKYRNSPESPIYQKRRTLYGLNWAKTDISHIGEAIVCEGYTDVIGFHRAGIKRAVATCGTALTEDHFRVLARFAKKIVLVFDSDAAGQNAAARLYEWERRHELEISVATLPPGSDPGSLAETNPELLAEAVASPRPFLAFSIDRALQGADLQSPEGRSRAAETAIAVVAEHPNDLVRDEYLNQIADRTRFAPDQLRSRLEDERAAVLRGEREPVVPRVQREEVRQAAPSDADEPPPRDDDSGAPVSLPRRVRTNSPLREESAGRNAIALAIHFPSEVAGKLDASLFLDPVQRGAFHSLATSSELHEAIEKAEPESGELLRRLAVAEVPGDVGIDDAVNMLVLNAVQVALRELDASARLVSDEDDVTRLTRLQGATREAREDYVLLLGALVDNDETITAAEPAGRLLAWLRQQDGGARS